MIRIPYADDHTRNQERVAFKYTPCIICGRAIKAESPAMVRVYWGTHIVTKEEAEQLHIEESGDGGDLYYYPIGPDCLRKYPDIKPYVHKGQS